MLELQNVSFRYTPKGKNILSGFSASFGEGELVAITGRNGSGKLSITARILRKRMRQNAVILLVTYSSSRTDRCLCLL